MSSFRALRVMLVKKDEVLCCWMSERRGSEIVHTYVDWKACQSDESKVMCEAFD
jgi:hypothetical protein